MKITIGAGVSTRHFTIQGNSLVGVNNNSKTYDFKSQEALQQWIGTRLMNGTAEISN